MDNIYIRPENIMAYRSLSYDERNRSISSEITTLTEKFLVNEESSKITELINK